MASENPKKRKFLFPDLKNASFKRKKSSFAQDSKGCAIFAKLIESGVVSDHEAVFYLRKKDKSVMKEGAITRNGVLCRCCNLVFLLSRFEAHAGSTLHRPCANMFLRDGRSLVECQQAVDGRRDVRSETSSCRSDASKDMQSPISSCKSLDCSSCDESSVSQANDSNDNMCQLCGDGGKLILCDTCPSAYHAECLFLNEVPDGDWHCPRCCCGTCGGPISRASSRSKALATSYGDESSRVSSELSSELATDDESSQRDGQKVRESLSCMQCQVPHHRDCVEGTSQRVFDGHWFCTKHCKRVFKKLRKRVGRVFQLDRGLSWMLMRSCKEDEGNTSKSSAYTGFEKLLSEACEVLQQSFDPVIDHETGVDLLVQTLFNKKSVIRRLDCSGFYAMLLMKGEQLVSVATIRVHGKMLAEMPFIATRDEFRQQGMCKTLMQALESWLQDIGIYKLILPSIDELLDAWRGPFGFKVMNVQDCKQVSGHGVLLFPGTTLLYKSLLKSEATNFTAPVPNTNEAKEKSGPFRIKLKLPPSNEPILSAPSIPCH